MYVLNSVTGGHRKPVQPRLSRGVQGTRNACRSAKMIFISSGIVWHPRHLDEAGKNSSSEPFLTLTNSSTVEYCHEMCMHAVQGLWQLFSQFCTSVLQPIWLRHRQAEQSLHLMIDACAEEECKYHAPQGSAWRESARNVHASDTASFLTDCIQYGRMPCRQYTPIDMA